MPDVPLKIEYAALTAVVGVCIAITIQVNGLNPFRVERERTYISEMRVGFQRPEQNVLMYSRAQPQYASQLLQLTTVSEISYLQTGEVIPLSDRLHPMLQRTPTPKPTLTPTPAPAPSPRLEAKITD